MFGNGLVGKLHVEDCLAQYLFQKTDLVIGGDFDLRVKLSAGHFCQTADDVGQALPSRVRQTVVREWLSLLLKCTERLLSHVAKRIRVRERANPCKARSLFLVEAQ